MDTATQNAVPKIYIPEWLKLNFFNNSNLKTDIQNRIGHNVENDFLKALNDIKGDTGNGQNFSDVTLLALAYFYSEIFTDKIQNQYYTLEMVKGFFDTNNLTPYTAIHEIDVKFYPLNNAKLLNHCWLIIQSAWYFNSVHFGHHQHIDYVNHYITTGQKMNVDNYKFDAEYLEKKYKDVDNDKKNNIPINGFTLVSNWYYSILFLVCKELNLSTENFKVSEKDNRIYNPLTKSSRQLRPLTPFKRIECDIKSAFPTFLDIEAGAELKDHVYNNLMKSKNITRPAAKLLFNKICNSGAYKSEAYTIDFFKHCGYSEQQCNNLIGLTHNKERKFISFMTEYEALAINLFVVMNDLKRGARLHDAIVFIDNKTKPQILKVHPNCDFGYKELNRPIIKNSFLFSNKQLPYAFINSIPKGLNLITKQETKKPDVIGTANGFKFYGEKFFSISAGFNLNNYRDFLETVETTTTTTTETIIYNETQPTENPFPIFINLCKKMLDALCYLNKRKIKPLELELILKHIRRHSNYIFNVRAVYLLLMKYNPRPEAELKNRDFDLIADLKFKKNIDFLNAMNEAKKIVFVNLNYKDLIDLMSERIFNNDYDFINEIKFKGKKTNNLLSKNILLKFNMLCSGRKNKPTFDTLFINDTIKSVTKTGFSTIDIKKERAKINRKQLTIKKTNERIEQNKERVHQLFLLLCSVAGRVTDLQIIKNDELQNQLKHELIQDILKIQVNNIEAGAKCFDYLYPPPIINEIPFNTDLTNSFDTDLKNSIFNQLTLSEAQAKGTLFLNQYLKFHKVSNRKKEQYLKQKQKEQFEFTIIKFED